MNRAKRVLQWIVAVALLVMVAPDVRAQEDFGSRLGIRRGGEVS